MSQKKISNQNIEILVNSLLNDNSYHIEFNGHLTNHNKHAVIALQGLGAPLTRIKYYYENYAQMTPYGYGLEKPKKSIYHITEENWQKYLGKRTSYSSYCRFFDEQEQMIGMPTLLTQYLPLLLPGWVGSLTHAAIHLGWALEINHRWMIIEGLAYMAFSYIDCHKERAFFSTKNMDYAEKSNTVLNSLIYIASIWEEKNIEFKNWVSNLMMDNNTDLKFHPELLRSGLQYRIAKMLSVGHPLIYEIPSWLETENLQTLWKQMSYVVTILYMENPGDFLILHFITSLHAMECISLCLPITQQKTVIHYYWIGMLCILFSRGEFPKKNILVNLHEQYSNTYDNTKFPGISADWKKTISRAIEEEEEHNPKLVYVLEKMWKKFDYQSIFRVAAQYFTTTPELPKSFENPPYETSNEDID